VHLARRLIAAAKHTAGGQQREAMARYLSGL
jgi:hypothetical protein